MISEKIKQRIEEQARELQERYLFTKEFSSSLSKLGEEPTPQDYEYKAIFDNFIKNKMGSKRTITPLNCNGRGIVFGKGGIGILSRWSDSANYEEGYRNLIEIFKEHGEEFINKCPEKARGQLRIFLELLKNVPDTPYEIKKKVELTDKEFNLLKRIIQEEYGEIMRDNISFYNSYDSIYLEYNLRNDRGEEYGSTRYYIQTRKARLSNEDTIEAFNLWVVFKDKIKRFCEQVKEDKKKSIQLSRENFSLLKEAFKDELILKELKESNKENGN